jgi:riboflavin synthase alpha subunit
MSWASRHNLLARSVNRSLGGVSVVWGAVSGLALLEQNTEMVIGDQVLSIEYALHNLPAASFGGMAHGDAVTVDGVSYTVRHAPMLVGDGRFCVVALSKA